MTHYFQKAIKGNDYTDMQLANFTISRIFGKQGNTLCLEIKTD